MMMVVSFVIAVIVGILLALRFKVFVSRSSDFACGGCDRC